MLKKISVVIVVTLFIFTSSCGTIFKGYQRNKPHSSNLDVPIVVLDSLGLLLFIIPGVVALTMDYMNGTLYLPKGKVAMSDMSDESIQRALADNGYNVSLQQIKEAKQKAKA